MANSLFYANSTQNNNKKYHLVYCALLADTPEHQENILQYQGFKFVCNCLKSEEKDVLRSTMKAVGHFMQDVTKESIVWQFVNAEGAASLLKLTAHTNKDISDVASSLILSFVKQHILRPCLGNAGAIDYFIDKSKSDSKSPKERIPFINSLCLFCHEVINRVRIRNGGGLELFLSSLEDDQYFVIHYRIISSLVCFLYDDPSMELLIQNKIVKILIHHLRKCSETDNIMLTDTLLYTSELERKDIIKGHIQQCTHSRQHTVRHSDRKILEEDKTDSENELKKLEDNRFSVRKHSVSSYKDCQSDSERTEDDNMETNYECEKTKFHKSASEPLFFDPEDLENGENVHGNPINQLDNKVRSTQRQKSETKYSIDSPTYREISDWNFDTEDRRGSLIAPRNIFEAQRNDSVSPDMFYPYHSPVHASLYSPLSTTSYASPSWSMGSSPQRCTSPTWSDSLYSSPQNSPGISNPSGLSASMTWSPSYDVSSEASSTAASNLVGHESTLFSPPTSCPLSPLNIVNSPGSPVDSDAGALGSSSKFKDLWWGSLMYKNSTNSDVEQLIYSDEEESEATLVLSKEKQETSEQASVHAADEEIISNVRVIIGEDEPDLKEIDSSMKFLSQDSDNTSYSIPLHADPVYSHTIHVTDFGKVLQGESLARAVSVESVEASSSQPDSKKKVDTEVEGDIVKERAIIKKRKRSDSFYSRSALKKKRNESSTSLLDQLLDQSQREYMCDEETDKKTKHGKSDNKERVHSSEKYSSTIKSTENNILIILSRLSYMDEKCTHLLNEAVLNALILYVIHAKNPIQRAERMLLRLAKNPICLEGLLLYLLPVKFDIVATFLKKYSKYVKSYPCSEVSVDAIKIKSSNESGNAVKKFPQKTIHWNWNCLDLFNDLLMAVSMVVMSKYGKGVVQHMLLAGSPVDKVACCLSLPVVCREENFLRVCVMDNGGLSSLVELFSLYTEEDNLLYLTHCLHRLAISGDLSLLLNGIGINAKCELFKSYFDHHHKGKDIFKDVGSTSDNMDTDVDSRQQQITCDLSDSVIFVFDNNAKVEANRSVLSAKSNVFSAMLDGHYSERDQKEIHIPHINDKSFAILIQLLLDNPTGFDSLYQSCLASKQISDDSFELLLDVLKLCDQYLLNDFQLDISNIMFSKLVTNDNIVQMLHFSLRHNCSLLSKRCLSYIMLEKVPLHQRLEWMKEIVQVPELEEVIVLVNTVFQTHMPTKMQICKM